MDRIDRETIQALRHVDTPSDAEVVQAARLVIRYRDSRLSRDLYHQLQQTLDRWSLSVPTLFRRARSIWQSGWRPGALEQDEAVGSGADVES